MTVTRYDVAELGQVERTPQGFLRAPAYLTRAGILEYRRADGRVVRELRPPQEVFSAMSLGTLSAAPLTDLHPPEMVTPGNVRKLAIGIVSDDVRRDGDHVAARVTVQDAASIAAVEAGERRELSCGYQCELDETPGEYKGERYDAVQRNIRYNHVGLGPRNWGRAGSTVALRLDASAAVTDATLAPPTAAPTSSSSELEALRAEVSALHHRLDEASNEDAMQAERDALLAQIAAMQTDLEASRSDAADGVNARALDRAMLLEQARRVLPEYKPGRASDRQIHEHVLQHIDGRRDMHAAETDDYVRSRFDSALERWEQEQQRTRSPSNIDSIRAAMISGEWRNDDDVFATLDGKHRIERAPRAYEPPLWRQPLGRADGR